MKLHIVSLGCARNLIDSEIMSGRLLKAGWESAKFPEEADIIIVNTCGFIESAVNESIDAVLAAAELKKTGKCRSLIVTGCLPERFKEKVGSSLPEVDIFLGTGAYDKIEQAVGNVLAKPGMFPPASAAVTSTIST